MSNDKIEKIKLKQQSTNNDDLIEGLIRSLSKVEDDFKRALPLKKEEIKLIKKVDKNIMMKYIEKSNRYLYSILSDKHYKKIESPNLVKPLFRKKTWTIVYIGNIIKMDIIFK